MLNDKKTQSGTNQFDFLCLQKTWTTTTARDKKPSARHLTTLLMIAGPRT